MEENEEEEEKEIVEEEEEEKEEEEEEEEEEDRYAPIENGDNILKIQHWPCIDKFSFDSIY